jgi:hypothetical protein
MKNNRYQTAAIILFFLILILVPVFWFTPGRPVVTTSIIEGRNLEHFSQLALPDFQVYKTSAKRILQGQYLNAVDLITTYLDQREYQRQTEQAASDQFPFRMSLIQTAKTLERGMIQLAYSFLDDPAIPADMRSGLVVSRDGKVIDYKPLIYNDQTIANMDQRIKNYGELIAQNPGINFYVYYIERIHTSPYDPLNPYFPQADKGQAFGYFARNKPTGLFLEKFQLNSLNDRLNYFYRTDHHWNIRGAWKAYEDIYKMLAPNYAGINPVLKLKGFKSLPGLKFYGSFARLTYYPIQPDDFEVADAEMPPLKIFNRHGTEIVEDAMTAYENGKYDTTPFVNHYASFGGNRDQFLFVNDSGPARNLLVISSSFAPPIIRFLAAHYARTYFVDLRAYEQFSLQEFMNSYPIDDVIVIGDSTAIEDPDWIINP